MNAFAASHSANVPAARPRARAAGAAAFAALAAASRLAQAAAAPARRGREPGAHQLWDWIEENSAIVYPALALVIIGLIVAALLATWKSEEMSADERGKLKMRILQIIRRRISGVSAEQVAAELQIDLMLAARLLGELVDEGGVSASGTGGQSPVHYRMRGHGENG